MVARMAAWSLARSTATIRTGYHFVDARFGHSRMLSYQGRGMVDTPFAGDQTQRCILV